MLTKITSIISILLITCVSSHAMGLSAKATVDSTDVYVGETFGLEIQVSGSENPEQPDLSHMNDFTVEYAGGSQNSSSSITIINGKMTKNETKGYIFRYNLTPKKFGTLVIPSIKVKSGNSIAETNPIVIVAKKPVETDAFKLRLKLSKDVCYVGEPVVLTVTWYVGKNVQNFNFNLPVVTDNRFNIENPEIDKQPGEQYYQIQLGNGEAVGEKGRGILDNRQYTTITFKKVLIPKESGMIPIDQATVTCSALAGYSRRNDNPFPDFFNNDFFGHSSMPIYKTVVVPSNSLNLEVKKLPEKGKPANFSGNIGVYKIETSATPTKVHVGDPITLTIRLSGPEYLEHVELPSLKTQPDFKNNFRIPDERASGEIINNSKVFTQTIRPLSSAVKEIPAVELPYFDTARGEYRIARSKPIPLIVKETKVVTLSDAEGVAAPAAPVGNNIQSLGRGIAYNYQGMSVLEKEYLMPLTCFKEGIIWPVIIFFPPLVYILLFTVVFIHRRRSSDPLKVLSRKAYGNLKRNLEKARRSSPDKTCALVLDSFREYLGIKLRMPAGGAITFMDVRYKLESMGMDQNITDRLKTLFESCEAGRYAGNINIADNLSLVDTGIRLAGELEKSIK